MSAFHLTTASVPGREHLRLFRNNQDAVGARVEGEVAVMVVTDGCGSGASSEVGARLGARFLTQRLPALAREHGLGPLLAERAAAELVEWVAAISAPLEHHGAALCEWIADHWLFTLLCAVMDPKHALVFGIGDGLWSADGQRQVLDSGSENAPDYVAYRLVPTALEGARGVPVVHFLGESHQLAVATDGLAAQPSALEALAADGAIWRNPMALQRRLRVLSERERLLHDDTSVALMKRIP